MKSCESRFVHYGSNGIFQVKDIRKRTNKEGVIEDWYVLVSDSDGVMTSVMTPVHNDLIRPILTKSEIKKLIADMPNITSVWIEDKQVRFQKFRAILDSGNVYELVQLIRSIYMEKCKREEIGKTISEKDTEIFKFAENLFFEEISISYDIKKEEVLNFINCEIAIS